MFRVYDLDCFEHKTSRNVFRLRPDPGRYRFRNRQFEQSWRQPELQLYPRLRLKGCTTAPC